MGEKTKDAMSKIAWSELMELHHDLTNYCTDAMKRKDASFAMTTASDLDVGAIQRVRKLLESEMKRA